MVITVADIYKKIDEFFPFETCFSWDNCGLIIGRPIKKVKKILLTLDVTSSSVKRAIDLRVDLIITHHPPIFKPISSIVDNLFLQLIKNDISVISVHTNLDVAMGGVNYAFARKVGYKEVEPIIQDEKIIAVSVSCGRINPKEFAKFVKKQLNAPFVRLYSPLNKKMWVEKVAFCGGAGSSFIEYLENKVDLLVSSDFTYHTLIKSKIHLIDVGHFYSEFPAMSIFEGLLDDIDLDIYSFKIDEINSLSVI